MKTRIAAAATALMLLATTAVHAQAETPAQNSTDRQTMRQDNRSDRQGMRQGNRADRQAEVTQGSTSPARQANRQGNRADRQTMRQGNRADRQSNAAGNHQDRVERRGGQ